MTKNQVLECLGVLFIVMVFFAGRYSAAPHGISKAITTDTAKEKDTHKQTTTVIVETPTGEKKTTTVISEDTVAKTVKHEDIVQTPIYSKRLNVSALVGLDPLRLQPVYGVSVSKDVLGPVSIGAFALTNGTFGASIGVSF